MKILRSIFDFYLNASIHVAFGVFALVNITAETLNVSIDFHLSWFLFYATIVCYNFIKYGVEAEKYILVANHYHKGIQVFSFVILIPMVYHAYFLNLETWLGIVALLIMVGLYTLPILPNTKNLRSLGILKIFIVAFVWSGVTVVIPLISIKNNVFSLNIVIEVLQRFLVILILLIPFEIRDLVYDDKELRTLPQRYGVANTKSIGSFMVVFFFALTFLKNVITHKELVAKGVLFLALGSLMFVTKRNQSKYFSSFWVESIPILWWGIIVLMNREEFKVYLSKLLSF